MNIVNMKKFGAAAVIGGAMAGTFLGVGTGVASADEWKVDKPHWNDWDGEGGEGRDWDGWRGDPYWNGPRYGGPCVWVPPAVSMWVPPAVC